MDFNPQNIAVMKLVQIFTYVGNMTGNLLEYQMRKATVLTDRNASLEKKEIELICYIVSYHLIGE